MIYLKRRSPKEHLSDLLVFTVDAFDFFGSNVLSLENYIIIGKQCELFYQSGLVDMFLSVNNFNGSVFHPLSDISGVEPAIFIDGLGSLLRLLEIT